MSKRVIIVESPAKSKTIESYFKHEVMVLSSVGHIRDLSISGKERLGVDIEHGFEPKYQIIKGKNKLVQELIQKTKGKEVLLATDPDREGEAIAWHLAQVLNLDPNLKNRIVFREITKSAINEAIKEPRSIDQNLVNSQETRRILDRIIGFKLSQLLRNKIKSKSAGRVQSVALKLICDLEKEIQAFIPEEYYTIHAHFSDFKADYRIPKDKKIKREEADYIVGTSTNPFTVTEINEKDIYRQPKLPLITSTLQQEAINSLGLTSQKVMSIAQKLYEGVEIEGERTGLITYMRTDSTRLSQEFIYSGQAFIKNNFGEEYVGRYQANVKENSQDAHEAIRPTNIYNTPEKVEKYLTKEEFKVYKKIYERALGSLMRQAVFKQTSIVLKTNEHLYELEGMVLKFDGFYKVSSDQPKDKLIPEFKIGEQYHAEFVEALRKETQPPARYSEATLIKELESKGIGRPSTYATIIQTLKSRDYVVMDKKRFIPTEQGMLTVEELSKFFTSIMNVEYTSKMEHDLDIIAEGKMTRIEVLNEFYKDFIVQYQKAQNEMTKIKAKETDKICPICGSKLVIRKSKYGEFLGCSSYPKCKYKEPIQGKM